MRHAALVALSIIALGGACATAALAPALFVNVVGSLILGLILAALAIGCYINLRDAIRTEHALREFASAGVIFSAYGVLIWLAFTRWWPQ